MKINACFYTNEKFRFRESNLLNYLKNIGFDNVYSYKSEEVKVGTFYEENKEILNYLKTNKLIYLDFHNIFLYAAKVHVLNRYTLLLHD